MFVQKNSNAELIIPYLAQFVLYDKQHRLSHDKRNLAHPPGYLFQLDQRLYQWI